MDILFEVIIFMAIFVTGFSRSDKIVGGKDTTIEKHPHQVSLQNNDGHICGGSIIGENWVISAAHCDIHEQYWVRVGSTYREEGGLKFKISRKFVHRHYNKIPMAYDYLLLKLSEKLQYDSSVQPIALGGEKDTVPGTVAIATGWGLNSSTELTSPDILQEANITLRYNTICKNAFPTVNYNDRSMLCTATKGVSLCFADSGGPLVIRGKLIGVTSFGDGSHFPHCRAGVPVVFANVPGVRRWIKQVSGI